MEPFFATCLQTCPYEGCGVDFDRKDKLQEHILAHFNLRPFVCSYENCGKTYNTKSHLDRHIKTSHLKQESGTIHCCPICLNRFSNRQNLKRHLSLHTSEGYKNKFSCPECSIFCYTKDALSAHMYSHTGTREYSCDMCAKECVTSTELRKHMRCHKAVQCPECQLIFNHSSLLQLHKKIAHVVEEYICDHCSENFKDRRSIVMHLKTHSDRPSFPCPYERCDKAYSRNSNLNQHILRKHHFVTFDCHLCDAQLSTKAKLDYHIKNHFVVKVPKPPKTKATGRKVRKDKGVMKPSTAAKIFGLR